ncbi:MAG: hypothetical protein ACLGHC_04390 [Alphaproteobacteria bacterium]
MYSTIRKSVMAMSAAALLFGQAAHASSSAQPVVAVDPLVAVSILGTSQSRGAVCEGAANCALPSTTSPSATATLAAASAAAAAAQTDPNRRDTRGLFWILLLGGGMVLIAVLVAALAGDEEDPISPE